MAEYDLTPRMAPNLDRHLVFPLLEFLQERQLYDDNHILKAKIDLLNNTNMVDYAMDIHKTLYHTEDVPQDMVERRADVVARLKSLEDAAAPLVAFLQNPAAVQELRADKHYNLQMLNDKYQIGPAQIEALYQYAKFQFECGNYSGAADYLYQYRALCTNSERSLNALWGKLAAEVLMQNWDIALEELNRLKEIIDSKNFSSPINQVQSRIWLMHWSLFIFFNHDNGRTQIIDLFNQDKYLNAIQTSAPHLLRYLATAFIVNKRRRPQFKDFIKVIQQEQNSYKDPITEFLACVYVNYDFDGAQKKMRECEEVILNDPFLGKRVEESNFSTVPLRDEFLENARLFIFETYCRIHQRIDMGVLAEKLNLKYEEAERWIVNLIRGSKLDAKIDSETGTVIMEPNHPNVNYYLCASCNMEIINNSPEISDNEEEDNVSQAREVPPQNAEEQEVASKPKKAKKCKAKKSNKDERKPKALTSDCWTYFDKVGFVDGVESAKCKGCGKLLSAASTGETTHLNRHKDSCMKSIKYHDVGDMMIGAEGKLRKKKFDPKANRELLAKMVITHGAPFNIVEWRVFRDYQKFLNDDCIFVTRNTISKDVLKVYGDEKQKLKSQLAQIRGRVCLTSDCWTACTNEGFISLTAHYVDLNWKLQNKILAFAHMEPPHTGRELALKVLEMLSDWGIEKKVFSITLDNASANDSMQNFLKEHLGISNSLLLKGEYFHIRCSAHVLNLIVQDGLKTISDELHKIRQSVAYVKVTESRTLAFFECAKNIGDIDTSIGLRTDCVTRWNSTYIMLHSAINYRRAFYSLSLRDSNFKCCPTSVEWRRAETLCDLLKPFFNITNLISGSSYPTSNLYFGEIWKIECLLRSYLRSEDPSIQNMTKKMKEKFDKYWSEYSVILAFATILDPTKKLNFVRYAYSKLDPVTSEDKSKNVKIMLEKLFAEYVNNEILSSNPSSSQQMVQPPLGRGPLPSVDEEFEEFEEFENQETTVIGKTELDTYLDELRMPSSTCFDILTYWKERSLKSPTLARIACDILSIPITTVASESPFSIGARVLTKYRSSMKDESVQALMCARSWLHGFEELGDVNNNDKDDESHESVQASNSVEYVNID